MLDTLEADKKVCCPSLGRQPLAHLSIDILLFQVYTPTISLEETPGVTAERLSPRSVFDTNDYLDCVPESWVTSKNGRGRENVSSYFVSVGPDQGLHFDLTSCENDEYYIAVVPSAGNVNPLTGLRAHGDMRQYEMNCPLHGEQFTIDHLCATCGVIWPKQNYIATTGTPTGHFCLPGCFCNERGMNRLLFPASEHMIPVTLFFYRSKETRFGNSDVNEGRENFFARKRARRIIGIEITSEATFYDDPNDLSFWNLDPIGMVVLYVTTREELARILQHC